MVFNLGDIGREHTERAMSPVVGKALESTLIVLYITLITATLYGGTVPEYRTAAGSEIAERTAADAAMEIERAVPPESVNADVRIQIEPPPTIVGETYRIESGERALTVAHPNSEITETVPLVVPDRIVAVEGSWQSGGRMTIVVTTTEEGLVVVLQ